jgi:IS30 family transposase
MHRLTKPEVTEIVAAFFGGEAISAIAKRIGRDPKTVEAHITKYQAAYGPGGSYIARMKIEIQHECKHPSLRCLCCGKLKDIIHREDRIKIRALEEEIVRLKAGKLGAV